MNRADARDAPETSAWLWILAGALGLYALNCLRYYVGYVNDDATYIVGARSLLMGSYDALYQPGRPPLTVYPPGLSLFLAPFVWLVAPHWELLKAVPLALTLLNGVLAWKLYQSWLPPRCRVAALTLFAWNPATVRQAGLVMSEPLFMAATLTSFLLLVRVLSRESTWEPWALGLAVGAAALTRSIGLLLIPAILAGLLLARRYRAAVQVLPVALALGGLFPLRNHLAAHQVSGYVASWSDSLSDLSRLPRLLDNLSRVTYTIFVHMLLALDLPRVPWAIVLNVALTLGVCAVLLAGLRSLNASPLTRALNASAGVLILTWYGVHALWTAIGLRYALPILPFLAAFFTAGALALYRGAVARRRLWLAAGLAVAGRYAWSNATFPFWETRGLRTLTQPPAYETWKWIGAHTPQEARFESPKPPEVYLYTGRASAGLIFADSAEKFRYEALSAGVTHVLARPMMMQSSPPDANKAWLLDQAWTASWPEAFKKVYENPSEKAAVYLVVEDAAYVSAYEAYRKACQDLANSSFEEGLRGLDRALKLYPGLTSALNAYGAASLLSGKNLPTAEARLKEAVRLRPGHALALLNLARLYRQTGRLALARQSLMAAAGAVHPYGEYDYLIPAIAQERLNLK